MTSTVNATAYKDFIFRLKVYYMGKFEDTYLHLKIYLDNPPKRVHVFPKEDTIDAT